LRVHGGRSSFFFIVSLAKRPGNVRIARCIRSLRTLNFSARDSKRSYYFRYISAGDALYAQVIEFPEYERPEASAMKNDFFNSFRIIKP
jgi:hypothetical protein